MKSPLLLLFILFASNLYSQNQTDQELLQLAKMMQGEFSSKRQAKSDSDFYSITLKIVPIWKHRSDAIWMYVEQALESKQDKPYRQRIYRLSRSGELFESAVFTLKDPLRFAGKPELLTTLNPDSLQLRDGCSVFLRRKGKSEFVGSTGERTCPSDMRGASFASSEVRITRKQLISWDRGYDADGKQVWGAEKGGYVFDRMRK